MVTCFRRARTEFGIGALPDDEVVNREAIGNAERGSGEEQV